MGLVDRTMTVVKSKINKLIEKAEDPMEALDHSYEKQLDLIRNVKKGIADLSTAKKGLEQQKMNLCKSIFDIEDQAKGLLEQGKETLARTALERKVQTQEQIDSLTQQIKKLAIDQNNLIEKEKTLELKLEEFKAKKETMKAQYLAAKAQADIGESLSGMGNNVGNPSDAMRRAEDKTNAMNARTGAIEELTNSGVLNDGISGSSSIDREIESARNKGRVDKEFEALKGRVRR